MSLHKAVFTLTANADGRATSDKRILASVAQRSALLDSVTLTHAAANLGGTPELTVTLNEILNVSDLVQYPWNDSTEIAACGNQVFFGDTRTTNSSDQMGVDSAGPRYRWTPRLSAVTVYGEIPATDVLDGRKDILQTNVRCEINGGVSGDIYTVTMFYETGNW